MRHKFVGCLLLLLSLAANGAAATEAVRWFAAGRPTAQADQAVQFLLSASRDGLTRAITRLCRSSAG